MRLWVEQLPDNNKDLWNEWVSSHPDAHFYHLWEWGDVLSATYNYRRYYFVAKSAEGIVGVFPLVHIQGRIFESKLVSLPFCEYGGPLLSNSLNSSTSNVVAKLFVKVASDLARDLRVDYLEIRQPSPSFSTLGFFPIERYLTFRVKLVLGEAEVWGNINKKCRNAIRKAEKSGVRILDVDIAHVKEYYGLHLDTEKRHGSPPHSEAFFHNLWRLFNKKGLAKMVLASYEGRPIGGVIVFCFNGRIYWWSNVTDKKHGGLNPTNFLLWKIIQWGTRNNFKIFDLGRTRSETVGIYHFKSSWGGQPISLKDYIWSAKEITLPDPYQRKYVILSKIWSKLPSVIAQHVGPRIVKEIGL